MEIRASTTDIDRQATPVRRSLSVGRRAASGAVWVFLAIAVSKVLGVGTYFVLARLLSPDDFGLVRFALILVGAFTVLQDLGVPASIIHSNRSIKEVGGTALTINVGASALLFGAAVLVSPYMATLAGDDAVAPVLIALAAGLIVLALGSVQRAVLEKELEFRRKFVPEVVPLLVSGLLSIALAFLGFGAWSLVCGYLAKAITSSALLWFLSSVRPLPRFRVDIARELFRYGKHMSIISIVGFAAINVDYFIVGYSLGTYDLGLYTLAFLITSLPIQIVVEPVHRVMFPAYCKIRDDTEAVVAMYESSVTMVSLLTIPASLAIFVAGPAVVPVIFGDEWSAIGLPLQILAMYTAMRSIYRSFASVLAAVGRPDLVWKLNIVRLMVLVPAMFAFVGQWKLVWIAIAYVVVTAVFIPVNVVWMGRILNVPATRIFRLLVPQVAGGSLALLIASVLDATSVIAPLSESLIGVVALVVLSLGVYGMTTLLLNRNIVTLGRNALDAELARRRLRPT